MICPICNYEYNKFVEFIPCENFDNSYLYEGITIKECSNCGHRYNELSNKDLKNLMKYYEEEYAPINLSVKDKETDRPGSDNELSRRRYEELFDFVVGRLKDNDARILDVGCALGGFLNYMETKGYFNTFGIDMIKAYVDKANKENIKLGNVYNIPFEDNSFDLVILDQVLEHLANPRLAMKEIRRVLDKGGLCLIAVPDASRYNDKYFWIMREHIQHFNLTSVKLLAEVSGFELLDCKKTETPMIGTLNLPNLFAVLKVSGVIYCWGIGREFMYLYSRTRLKRLNLILVDDTPEKQKRTFKGMRIHGSNILKGASKDSFLIITANAYKSILKNKAKKLGYKGEIIGV